MCTCYPALSNTDTPFQQDPAHSPPPPATWREGAGKLSKDVPLLTKPANANVFRVFAYLYLTFRAEGSNDPKYIG